MAAEILATLDDINAHLDGTVVSADDDNTNLIQISVARIIRGYLARVIDNSILLTWVDPTTTPIMIREVAGMLIAAQLYFNKTSEASIVIDKDHYAQKLYDQAMAILNGIVSGSIAVPEVVINDVATIDPALDFFPIDDTDRAFTLSMKL